jgi:hypothetical protein
VTTAKPNNTLPVKKHHYVRTLLSSFFGFIALGLIIVSILVVWLDRTLTNTGQYVKTVAPLVTKPDVQNFVVTKVSSALLDNKDAPIQDIASQLLGPGQTAGKTDEQLKAQITPIVKDNLRSVVASPTFAALWKNNNQAIHGQLISQLNNNSQVITLNFHPLITGVIDQLSDMKLGFVKDKIAPPADVGLVTIQGKQLTNVRRAYDYFTKAMMVIVACAVLAAVLCVVVSVHHGKTFRRIALLTGVFSAILAALLSAALLIKTGGSDMEQQKMITALADGITHDLRLSLIVIAVLCIGGAIGSKIYVEKIARKP